MKRLSLPSLLLLFVVLLPAPSLRAGSKTLLTLTVTQGHPLWTALAENHCNGFWSGYLMTTQPTYTFGTIPPGTQFKIDASECRNLPSRHLLAVYREKLDEDMNRRAKNHFAAQTATLKNKVNSLAADNADLKSSLAKAQTMIALLQAQHAKGTLEAAAPVDWLAWGIVIALGIIVCVMAFFLYLNKRQYEHLEGVNHDTRERWDRTKSQLSTKENQLTSCRGELARLQKVANETKSQFDSLNLTFRDISQQKLIPEAIRVGGENGREYVFQLDHPFFKDGRLENIAWNCRELWIHVKTLGWIGEENIAPLRDAVNAKIRELREKEFPCEKMFPPLDETNNTPPASPKTS